MRRGYTRGFVAGAAALWLSACGQDGTAAPDQAPLDASADSGTDAASRGPDAGPELDAGELPDAAEAGGPALDAAVDAGDGSDGVLDAGVLSLLAREPEADADNVRARAPVVLSFSAALDPASVDSQSVGLRSPAGPIDCELQLSDDGRQLRLLPREVPVLPAQVTAFVSESVRDRSGRAFAGAQWSFQVPFWQRVDLAAPTGLASLRDAEPVRLAVDAEGRVLLAWLAGDGVVRVARLSGEALSELELLSENALDAGAEAGRGHALWIGDGGQAVLAFIDGQSVALQALSAAGLSPRAPPWVSQRELASVDVAVLDGAPVIAVVEGVAAERELSVWRYDEAQASWSALGAGLHRVAGQPVSEATLATAASGALAAGWLEHDGVSDNLYLARFDAAGGRWSPQSAAVDLELDQRVARPSLAIAAAGDLVALWSEGPAASGSASYVARVGEQVEALGGSLDAAREASPMALTLGAAKGPIVLLHSPTEGPLLLRDNGSAAPPFGLSARPQGSCSLPADGDPGFPETLSATGCFDDVPSRTPAAGLIPYTVASPLWSDGALKRRFVAIPEGESIGYRAEDAWALPVGTVLIKEFLLERTGQAGAVRVPMETRFLVKRCEPGACRAAFQGYSYQWDDAGSEAVLLDNLDASVFKDWASDTGLHRHGYPGRDECARCHATAAGGVLGLQTAQLNARHDYGAQVDNQVRALAQIGLFGDSLPQLDGAELAALPRLPRPYDPGEALDARVRSYLHVNCSHCHRPDGRWPVVDLRYAAELRAVTDEAPNICDKLVPGDAAASLLYQKVSNRPPDLPVGFQGDPMPPLATLITDPRLLPSVADWIEGLQSCP